MGKDKKTAAKASDSTTKVRVLKASEAVEEPKKVKKEKIKMDSEEPKKRRHLPKPIRILFTPVFAIGRYLRDSWRELRQVRWPNRKTTWKMTLAVIVYTLTLFLLIGLLDALFKFIFNKVLG